MADNAIDLIVAEKAFTQLQDLINKLGEVDSKITDTVKKANDQFKNIGTISTPSLSGDNSAEMAKLNKELKESIDLANKYKTQVIALSEAKKTYNREVTQDSVNATITNRNAREKFQLTSSLITKYEELDLKHKKAMKSAQALGAEFGSTSKKFLEASITANKLGDELKAIDATLGKNNRNVGNYKSGFNGLSNSINQLTREAPAFANSIGTGFMALSNNIPILADEIANLAEKNKKLVASGQPAESMFKTLIGAVFSWQTLLSVGVTLLTLYGAKMIEYVFGLSETEKAQVALNEAMSDSRNTITTDMAKLQSLTDIVKDHNESSINRKLAYDEIKKTLPSLTSATYEQAISTGELTKATDLYISSLIQKNIVEAEAKSIADDETALNKRMEKSTKERMGTFKYVMNTITGQQGQALRNSQQAYKKEDEALEESIKNRKEALKKSQEDFLKTQEALLGFTEKPKTDKSAQKAEEDRLKAIYEANKSAIERDIQLNNEKLNNEELFIIERLALLDKDKQLRYSLTEVDYNEQFRLAKGNHNKQITAENELVSNKSKINEDYNKKQTDLIKKQLTVIEKLSKSINETDPVKELGKSANATEKELYKMGKQLDSNAKSVEDFRKATEEYAKSFMDEFASNSGLSETFKMFTADGGLFKRMAEGMAFTKDSWKTDTIEIMQGVQEMYNFISNASQQNFDAEYARLESQKEIAIGFAGDSAVAKDKIEKDAEKRKKEIANRENKAKQKQAIFNIAIDTAQAIMSVWANTKNPITATALSIAVGALGAVQIGMVASQKIPQYFDGTDNHTGGLMLVNDGKGANYKEKIVLPNGQVILPQDRNVLMEAPKGTKVLNHEQQLFEMLQGKGVSMSVAQSQGMTADEMDMILAKHFSGIKTHNTTIDKNGFNSYIRNGNSITRMNSNRSQGIGLSV